MTTITYFSYNNVESFTPYIKGIQMTNERRSPLKKVGNAYLRASDVVSIRSGRPIGWPDVSFIRVGDRDTPEIVVHVPTEEVNRILGLTYEPESISWKNMTSFISPVFRISIPGPEPHPKKEGKKIDSSFRPLNGNEKSILLYSESISNGDIRLRHINDLEVSYEILPSFFTVGIVKLKEEDYPPDLGMGNRKAVLLWRGASCKSKGDRRNPIRGQIEAFKRMLKSEPVVSRVD